MGNVVPHPMNFFTPFLPFFYVSGGIMASTTASSQSSQSAYASLTASARQARTHAADAKRTEFEARMAYVNRCAEQLALQLHKAIEPYVVRACKYKNDDGSDRKPWAGTMISFTGPDDEGRLPKYPVCFCTPQFDDGSREFDPSVPVFVNARGEMFPQEPKPAGGFPVLDGDDKRIPISLCFVGYKTEGLSFQQTHDELAKRGVESVLVRLHKMLNAESPTAVYLNYIGQGRVQVSIAWSPESFEAYQNKNANNHAEAKGKEPRGWNYAICLPARGAKQTLRPRYNRRSERTDESAEGGAPARTTRTHA